MLEHRVKHGAEHDDAYNDADPKAETVQRQDALAHIGDTFAQIDDDGRGVVRERQQNENYQAFFQPAGFGNNVLFYIFASMYTVR